RPWIPRRAAEPGNGDKLTFAVRCRAEHPACLVGRVFVSLAKPVHRREARVDRAEERLPLVARLRLEHGLEARDQLVPVRSIIAVRQAVEIKAHRLDEHGVELWFKWSCGHELAVRC